MIRGLAKGALLATFGISTRTAMFYRTMTRDWMGSQATHVDKLRRVWPGYVSVWQRLNIPLQGAHMWVHEGGWTPFPFFANHLVTGRAGTVTNHEGRMLDRYLARAVNGAITCELPQELPLDERRRDLEPLRWTDTTHEAIGALGGMLHEAVDVGRLPMASDSVDLCHSGGTLEHYRPDQLAVFLSEARRVLRPGGVMSHVFDHRDHLHHADHTWPFLAHYGRSDLAQRLWCSGPLLYHNRMLPGQIAEVFERAGFERILIRRMMLPSRVYQDDGADMGSGEPGIERTKLATRFQDATDDDLRTAAAHYLYRKPA